MKFSFGKPKDDKSAPAVTPAVEKPPSKFSFSALLPKKKPKESDVENSITELPKAPKRAFMKSFSKMGAQQDADTLAGTEKPKKEKKEKKEKAPKGSKSDVAIKGKKPSFVRKARFTLLIGDEGAVLIHMKGSRVLSRQFVPDASQSNLSELRETIVKDDLAPITLIIDSMDQAFVQQTLPPVSSLSVQKLIKRRLDRDFKPEDIKGAIVLGKEKSGRKDWNFLMISVDKSPQMNLWLEFIMSFNNRFRGIVLLSVETEIFIKKLERAIGGVKIVPSPEWKFVVSHNKVGGFRQIVLKNGRLIFTRLAQPVGEPTPEVIAGNIEQEMLTTIEYLKRFGYDSRKGLEVFIIAAEPIVKILDTRRFDAVKSHVMTPYKVADYLGIDGATQPSDQFGDVIMAAAVGGSRTNVLKLTTVESRQYDAIQKLKYGQRLLGTFAILGLIVYCAYLGYNALLLNSDIEDLEQKIRFNQQSLEKTKKKVADSKINIETVTDKFELYKLVKGQKRTPLPTLTMVASAVKAPLVVKSVKLQTGDKIAWPQGMNPLPIDPALQAKMGTPNPPEMVLIVLDVDFPVGLKNAVMFKKFSEDTIRDIKAKLKDYTVVLSDTPKEFLDSNSLQISFERDISSKSTTGDLPVPMKITLYGPYIPTVEGVEEP